MSDAPIVCPGCDGERSEVFDVDGLDCGAEVAVIEKHLRSLPGVCSARASAATGQATVVHTLGEGVVERAIRDAGFKARKASRTPQEAARVWHVVASATFAGAGFLALLASRPLAIAFFLAGILVGGARIAHKGLLRARQGVLDMNALMTLAVVGAMAIGEWGEGAVTVVLFALAQFLESRSLERARRAISSLLDLTPEAACVIREGAELEVPADAVARGETIVVGPGGRFPLDGMVLTGVSDVDESTLTGESQPAPKQAGDEVLAGCINGLGVLTVRVTRASADTTLARILRRVEEAQASRAPSQGFVEAFAGVYTPVVIALAVAIAVAPPLLGWGTAFDWLYRALVMLVVACPCALVISTPVSIVSGITAASRKGVLIKGGAHLEEMGRLKAVAFDKTGTLTCGAPAVTDVVSLSLPAEQVLALAAAVEARLDHPLGVAVTAFARRQGAVFEAADEVRSLPGRGAEGTVGGRRVLVGSQRLFEEQGLLTGFDNGELARLEGEGKTAVLVGYLEPAEVAGILGVADAPRPEAAQAMADLVRHGLTVSLLTGDNPRTAAAVAHAMGIEEFHAELLPEQKAALVQALRHRVGSVAMVGDGVNDAPALATASVGIAMGERGSDVALETADVVLMSDDLRRVVDAVRLGRATRRVIRENIGFALAVKALVLGLAVLGYASLWEAVVADMGASLLVIGNGLRLLQK
jgi:Cd2+/Zn2+-exporting ATPase